MGVDRNKVINQLTLRQGDYPVLSGWAQYNQKGPKSRRRHKYNTVRVMQLKKLHHFCWL